MPSFESLDAALWPRHVEPRARPPRRLDVRHVAHEHGVVALDARLLGVAVLPPRRRPRRSRDRRGPEVHERLLAEALRFRLGDGALAGQRLGLLLAPLEARVQRCLLQLVDLVQILGRQPVLGGRLL